MDDEYACVDLVQVLSNDTYEKTSMCHLKMFVLKFIMKFAHYEEILLFKLHFSDIH